MDGDMDFDQNDINLFVLALTNIKKFRQARPGFDPATLCCNTDDDLDFDDIPVFEQILAQHGYDHAVGSVELALAAAGVPEPGSATLFLLAAIVFCPIRTAKRRKRLPSITPPRTR
jgi:hypothetical protein